MNAPLTTAALDVLRAATVDGQAVKIRPGLPRTTYDEVNEVFARLGGRWKGGRTAAHLFPYNPAALLTGIIAAGTMPPKNPTDFFPTSPDVADRVAERAETWLTEPDTRVLEPSAGHGALCAAALRINPTLKDRIDCVEILAMNAAALRAQGFQVHERDFLTFTPTHRYRVVLMNPPFQRTAFIDHILHAWSLLADSGVLVAVVPVSYETGQTKKHQQLRDLIQRYGDVENLPPESFKDAGTLIDTAIVCLIKPDGEQPPEDPDAWHRRPHQGWPSHDAWSAQLTASCDFLFYQAIDALFRAVADGQIDLHGDKARARIESAYHATLRRANFDVQALDAADWDALIEDCQHDYPTSEHGRRAAELAALDAQIDAELAAEAAALDAELAALDAEVAPPAQPDLTYDIDLPTEALAM